MRFVLTLMLSLFTAQVVASDYARLYQSAGWHQHQSHFSAALKEAQARYQGTLPPAVFNALVANSNQRFEAGAMQRRGEEVLRVQLSQPQAALAFFESPLGRRVVAAETHATSPQQLRANAAGVPQHPAELPRRAIIAQLSQSIPAAAAAAEVSLALAGVAADSLSAMLPGMPMGGGMLEVFLQGRREALITQMQPDIEPVMLHVYRELSDDELNGLLAFAQSNDGQAYYRATLSVLRVSLAPPATDSVYD